MRIQQISIYIVCLIVCLLTGCFFKTNVSTCYPNMYNNYNQVSYQNTNTPDINEIDNDDDIVAIHSNLSFNYESLFQITQNYPQYYTSEIRNSVDSMTRLVSSDSVNYIFMTDLHIDSSVFNTIAIIRQLKAAVNIANNSPIDFLCIGGDLYNGNCSDGVAQAQETIRQITEILQECTKPIFILHGNHDDNSFTAQYDSTLIGSPDYILSESAWYDVTMANFSQYATDYHNGYYYYDLPDKNVRVVCLNMNDSENYVDKDGYYDRVGIYNYEYSNDQINWLLKSAFARTDCNYIILDHDGFDYKAGYDNESNQNVLKLILNAAVHKTHFTYNSFHKDFTRWNSQILLFNSGHLHQERLTDTKVIDELPLLSTDTASISRSGTPEEYAALGYDRFTDRTFGTIKEACFDIVIRNQTSIDVIRFGGGDDLTLNPPSSKN